MVSRIALSGFDEIVNIGGSYGGRQEWFLDRLNNRYLAERGCGIIAASHTIIYLALTRTEYGVLLDHAGLNMDSYLNLINRMSYHIKPTVAGIFTTRMLIKGMKSFCEEKSVKLKAYTYRNKWNEAGVAEFIREALEQNTPVLLLTWNHIDRSFRNHWITVTELYESDGRFKITASNWGQKRSYYIQDWLRFKSFHRALVYFV